MLKRKVIDNTAPNINTNINNARILYYDFFAGLFLYELLLGRAEILPRQIEILQSSALEESNLVDFEILKHEVGESGVKNLIREYTHTFLLPFNVSQNVSVLPQRRKGHIRVNPQIMLYLSHYTDGCLNAGGLLKARKIIKQSTFRLNSEEFKESEEHLGFLLLFMRYLLCSNDERDKPLSVEAVRELVMPLSEAVISSLLKRNNLIFYPAIARILRSFLEVERALL